MSCGAWPELPRPNVACSGSKPVLTFVDCGTRPEHPIRCDAVNMCKQSDTDPHPAVTSLVKSKLVLLRAKWCSYTTA
jgi:hypothetical protein